jgi:hypothetical protein
MTGTDCVFRFMWRYVRLSIAFDNVQLNDAIENRPTTIVGGTRRRVPAARAVPDAREARPAGRGLRPRGCRRSGPTRGRAAPRSGAVRAARGARGTPPRVAMWSTGSHVRTGVARPCASARADREGRLAVPASLPRSRHEERAHPADRSAHGA